MKPDKKVCADINTPQKAPHTSTLATARTTGHHGVTVWKGDSLAQVSDTAHMALPKGHGEGGRTGRTSMLSLSYAVFSLVHVSFICYRHSITIRDTIGLRCQTTNNASRHKGLLIRLVQEGQCETQQRLT